MDSVSAPYAVADVWGVEPKDIQVVGVNDCASAPRLKVIPTVPGTGASSVDRCKRLTSDWLPLLYSHSYMFPVSLPPPPSSAALGAFI